MRAGRLDRKASFYVKTSTRGDYNEEIETFTHSFDTWGEVTYAGGDAILSNEEKFYSGTIFLRVRYRSAITETMQVEINHIRYRITYIEELGRKEGLKITLQKLNE